MEDEMAHDERSADEQTDSTPIPDREEEREELADRVRAEGKESIATQALLDLFGFQRRGVRNNGVIAEWLGEQGLRAEPSIEAADYYGDILLVSETPDAAAAAPNDVVGGGRRPSSHSDAA